MITQHMNDYTPQQPSSFRSRRGRAWTTINDPNNFRTHVLNKYKINYQRVRGTSWFLIEWPSNPVAQARLQKYTNDSLTKLNLKDALKPFNYIIYIGTEKPTTTEVSNTLSTAVVNVLTSTAYMRNSIPTWWTHAQRALKELGLSFTIIDKGVTTETELLQRNGLSVEHYSPHSMNKDFICGYRLVLIKNIPPHLLSRFRHYVKTVDSDSDSDSDSDVYVVFRSQGYQQVAPLQKPFVSYVNMRLIEWATLNHVNSNSDDVKIKLSRLCDSVGISLNGAHGFYSSVGMIERYGVNPILSEIYNKCIAPQSANECLQPIEVLHELSVDFSIASGINDETVSIASGINDETVSTASGINDENSENFLTDKE